MKNSIYQILGGMEFATTLDWVQICNTINMLPEDHTEMIYVLILHHYFLESSMKSGHQSIESMTAPLIQDRTKTKSKMIPLPYGGKTSEKGRGAIYTVEKIPTALQQIISTYVHIVTSQ